MNRSWRRIVYLSGLGIGSLLFIYQIWNAYQAVVQHALHVSVPALLGVAWVILVVATGLQMMAWSRLMQGLGSHLPWRQVVNGYTLSFLPRYVPGSIWGYLSRGEWLRQSHDVAYRVSNLGSILEVLGILSASCLTLGLYDASVSTGLSRLVALILIALFPLAIWLILRWVFRRRLFRRLFANAFAENTSFEITLLDWMTAVILYLLLWLCYGGLIELLVQATGLPQRGGLIQHSFIFSFAWVVGFLTIFVPAGLGVREVVLSSLIAANLGLSPGQASAISVMSRLVVSTAELTWVLIGLALRQKIMVDWKRFRSRRS